MCEHGSGREAAMVTVARNAEGVPTVWCDPCIEPLIRALNDGGLATVASCCGHGQYAGWVMLADGRDLVIAPDHDLGRQIVTSVIPPGVSGVSR